MTTEHVSRPPSGSTVVPEQGRRPQSTEELRAEIARLRRELGDTVEALAAKADVKARARDSVARTRAGITERARRTTAAARARAAGAAPHPGDPEAARRTGMAMMAAGAATTAAGVAAWFRTRRR
ncbi:hypothetical protein HNP84_008854 [Thermocatellispora tengchongensis]|uniref:DUF3618 domain-containing protein n=1 Tax=Thermocatellispora tengchongensis TaxID=1073253 RepID=A0A840PMS9_9ACTN|nr:DUF3618 domain-containing protein [Thermocatellispora tengchongensis]MBB5139091.1 hypothetical protein [Thermocatellispora tengchongensis]